MAASITWDLVRPADLINTKTGFNLVRGVLVKGIDIEVSDVTGTDPLVLIKCLEVDGFPQLHEEFLDDPSYAWLTVAEQRVREIVRKDTVKFDIVYTGFPPLGGGDVEPTWVIQDDYTSSVVQTLATADGSVTISTWYKKDKSTFTSKPGGAIEDPVRAKKYVSSRHVKCIARMTKGQWDTRKAAYRDAACTINDDTWSGKTRGTWLFHGPRTTTTNTGAMVTAQLDFTYDKLGHFAVGAWFNAEGRHPKDCVTEAVLRGRGLPTVNGVAQGNGLTIASVQGESNFSTVFGFTIP